MYKRTVELLQQIEAYNVQTNSGIITTDWSLQHTNEQWNYYNRLKPTTYKRTVELLQQIEAYNVQTNMKFCNNKHWLGWNFTLNSLISRINFYYKPFRH